jgi:phosphoglycolate phosphatase
MPAPVAVFDLDGTLVDTAPDLIGTLNIVLVDAGYTPMNFAESFGAIGQGAKVMIERALQWQGVEANEALVKPMFERFLEHYATNIAVESRPFDGILDVLDRLANDGVRLAVCTNKLESLSIRLLDALGMTGRFAAIVGPDTLGVRKPDPAHILGTIERAGGDRSRAVMVGDSRADIDAARAAGIPVVAVDFGYTDTPVRELSPDYVISRYDVLYDIAAPLLGLSGDWRLN